MSQNQKMNRKVRAVVVFVRVILFLPNVQQIIWNREGNLRSEIENAKILK